MWRTQTTKHLYTKLLKPYSSHFTPATTTITSASNTLTSTAENSISGESQTSIKAHQKNIGEPDAGITCYISHLPGFRAFLKQRYSDFIVNEVDLDGNVVHLTSFDVLPELVEKEEEKVPEQSGKSYTSEIELFRSVAGDSDAELLKEFIEKVSSGADEDVTPLVLPPSSDKPHRTVRRRG